MLSMLRSSLVSEGANPITQHYRLVRLVGGAGQEMVWKIYEAFRIKDGKVSSHAVFSHCKPTQIRNGAQQLWCVYGHLE